MIFHKKIRFFTLIFSLLWLNNFAICQDIITHTEQVVQILKKDQLGKLYGQLDKTSKSQFSKKQLVQMWKSITTSYGPIKDHGKISIDTTGGETKTLTEVFLDKNSLILVLGFDQKNEIKTFRFLPQSYSMPPSAKNVIFGKRLLTIKTDTFSMDGELIFPLDVTNPPVVILVHGSGPTDLDESIGPNKIFKDLALMLAVKGIATFRYDKRSFVYREAFKPGVSFTIDEETTDDVKSAIELMLTLNEIDTSQIYVLGHSLGAYAAPKIAAENPTIEGIIMMAGPYQALYELIPVQFEYIFGLENSHKRVKNMMIKKARKWAALLRNKDYDELAKTKQALVYWPNDFFIDLENYAPAETIDTLTCRTLILQGVRDYQVPYKTEFLAFQKRLDENPKVTLQSFDGLNHLFLFGEGNSVPSEYLKPGNVSIGVINAIESWINEAER